MALRLGLSTAAVSRELSDRVSQTIIAQTLMQAAGVAGTEVLRISFGKTLGLVRSFWLTLAAGHGIITKKQAQALTGQMLNFLSDTLLPPRRKRSCPRKVRQPVRSWPRLTENSNSLGSSHYKVTPIFA